ncbi:MAG: PRC-barrel domain containing protein [Chloroflexi bacterium]|nr:PRC-barrel domain containing protein [Chloroflexota bacterium]
MRLDQMQFTENADVYDDHGEKVGVIDRVVIDPRTKEVSYVVVREGFLFTEDKVVPVEWFRVTTDKKVILNVPEDEVDKLPVFEEVHYMPWYEADRREPHPQQRYAQAYYWYPHAGVYWWGHPGYRTYFAFTEPPYTTVVERQIPENTVPLKEGAKVYSSDDKHVGDIERIFADKDSGRATHFVTSKGLIFKDRKLVPTAWIKTLGEDEVSLAVDASFLEHLETFKA